MKKVQYFCIPAIASLVVCTMVFSYFYILEPINTCITIDDVNHKLNSNTCYPSLDGPLSAPFSKPSSPQCGPYVMPDMPCEIANLKLGVDLPALAPEDKHNHTIIWSTYFLQVVVNNFNEWSAKFKLCSVPPTYQLLVDELFAPHLPKDWKKQTSNKVPCDIIYVDQDAIKSTQGLCPNTCYEAQENGRSLGLLPYMPSMVIVSYMWFSPRFLWMLSRYRSPKSLWVLEMNGESVVYYPTATHPFFQQMTNFSVGHSRAHFTVPFIPRGYTYEYEMRTAPPIVPLSKRNATAPIFWMQSNCGAPSNRHLIVQELMKYIDIDIYGSCLKNKDIPEWATSKYGDGKFNVKRALLENYAFVLSLENSLTSDYVTEKFWQPIAFGAVPVYLGAENVVDFIPAEYDPDNPIYIDLRDWESLENLAFYLKSLSKNETMWNRFHKWREIPRAEREAKSPFLKWLDEQKSIEPLVCAYCQYIHEGKEKVKWPSVPLATNYEDWKSTHPIIRKNTKQ